MNGQTMLDKILSEFESKESKNENNYIISKTTYGDIPMYKYDYIFTLFQKIDHLSSPLSFYKNVYFQNIPHACLNNLDLYIGEGLKINNISFDKNEAEAWNNFLEIF
jgi:hypothetical protein